MSSRQRLTYDIPDTARTSAVMALFFHKEETLNLLLIKRITNGKAHSGQISFPGGKEDPEDKNLLFTAIRETHEEVGVYIEDDEILGPLTPLYIPVSNYHVHPYVAYTKRNLVYNISENEVDGIIEVPLNEILHPSSKIVTDIAIPSMNGKLKDVKAYRLADGNIIWGATAMIISELETVIVQQEG